MFFVQEILDHLLDTYFLPRRETNNLILFKKILKFNWKAVDLKIDFRKTL